MIAIIGYVDVEPTERDGLITAVTDIQASTEADEPGCLAYTICADPARPGRIRITELWESAAALDAHFEHPNFRAAGAAMRGATRLGAEIAKYRIVEADTIAGPDGRPSSTFHSGEGAPR